MVLSIALGYGGLFSGFIDYIVTPTLSVCSDMVMTVLGGSTEFEKPWNGTLVVNKEKWQEKVKDRIFNIQVVFWLLFRLILAREGLILLMLGMILNLQELPLPNLKLPNVQVVRAV